MKNTKSFIAAAVLTLNFVLSTSFTLQAQPTYQWAFTLGGAGAEFDQGTKITYDASGNIYVIGQFSAASMDADPGTGTATLTNTSASSNDVFVASYTSAMVFRWAFSIGTSGGETGNDIKVDATNVYITGSLDVGTADFDPSTSTNNLTGWGGFVAKYTLDGAYSWAFLINETSPTAIAVDAPGGNVYITGIFGNTVDFNPGAGTNSITPVGFLGDMFVAKYSSVGAYDWAFNVTSDWDAQDDPETIEVDASNNVYIGGHIGAGAIDFDPGAGATNLVGSGLFLASYTTAMAHRWSFTIAGGGDYALRSIVTDGINVYATGGFDGSSDFDPGPGTTTLTAPGVSIPEDIFVAAYTAATGAYVWAFNPTGLNSDYGRDIALGCSGDVLVTGRFQGTVDFDPSTAVAGLSVVGGTNDIFVARYTAASGAYVWARQIGSDGGDDGLGVAANATDVYLTGYFQDAGDFDPTVGIVNLIPSGFSDAYVAKWGCGSQLGIEQMAADVTGYAIQAFPNPLSGGNTLNIHYIAEQDGEVTLQVYDVIGKLVKEKSVVAVKGNNKFTMDLSTVAQGMYILRVNNGTVKRNENLPAAGRFVKE